MKGAKFTYLFYFLLTKYNERTQFVEEMFFTKNLRQVNFSIFIVLQTTIYIAERFVIHTWPERILRSNSSE